MYLMKRERGVSLWGAQAPRLLAMTPSSSRTFFRQCAQTKFVSASRRRNAAAKRRGRAFKPAREARALPKPVLTLQVIQVTSPRPRD